MGAIRHLRCSPSVAGDDCVSVPALPAWAVDCPTPIKTHNWTPQKRRRLTIAGSNVATLSAPVGKLEDCVHKTSSRADAASESGERIARMLVCDCSRSIIREICSEQGGEVTVRAQVLACQFLQSFFATAPVHNEAKDAISIAAAFLALKDLDVTVDAEDAIRAFNIRRANIGQPAFRIDDGPLESLRSPSETIVDMAERLLRTRRHATPLPLDHIDKLVDRLVERLPSNSGFQKACVAENLHDQALRWRPQLARTARCFVADASLVAEAFVAGQEQRLAGAAVALAAKFLIFRNQQLNSDFGSLLVDNNERDGITQAGLQFAVNDILAVFRLWKEIGGASAAPL